MADDAAKLCAPSRQLANRPGEVYIHDFPARWRLPHHIVELDRLLVLDYQPRLDNCANSLVYPASADFEPLTVIAGKCAGASRYREPSEENHHLLLLRLAHLVPGMSYRDACDLIEIKS